MTRTELEHQAMVAKLAKPGLDIIQQLDPRKAHLWHMASAAGGESGELFDAIKRYAIYDKALDRENVIEELGDLEFYLQGIREGLGITREETLRHNITKLLTGTKEKAARYASGSYSDKQAQDRADKS